MYIVMFKSQTSAALQSKLRLQRNVRYAVISIYSLLLYNTFLHHIKVFILLPYSLPHPQSIRNHQLPFAKFAKCHITNFEQHFSIYPRHCFPFRSRPCLLVSPATSGVLPSLFCILLSPKPVAEETSGENWSLVEREALPSQLVISNRRW
jgi:hypothetical protein